MMDEPLRLEIEGLALRAGGHAAGRLLFGLLLWGRGGHAALVRRWTTAISSSFLNGFFT